MYFIVESKEGREEGKEGGKEGERKGGREEGRKKPLVHWRDTSGENEGPLFHPRMMVQGLKWKEPFRCDTGMAIQMSFGWVPEDLVPKGGTIGKLKKQSHLVVSVILVGRGHFSPYPCSQEKPQPYQ